MKARMDHKTNFTLPFITQLIFLGCIDVMSMTRVQKVHKTTSSNKVSCFEHHDGLYFRVHACKIKNLSSF